MPAAPCNGITIAYEDTGDGVPVLLIMGLNAQLVHWPEPLVERLVAAGLRVIRHDNRDAGRSTHLDELGKPPLRSAILRSLIGFPRPSPYSLADMAEDARALLDHLELPSAHIVGCSLGGMIAQVLACRHPNRVRTLTSIMSTTGGRYFGKPRAMQALLAPPPFPGREGMIERSVNVFRTIAGSRFRFDEESCRAVVERAFDRGMTAGGFCRQLAAVLAAGDRSGDLRRLEVPTLVVHGDEDPLIPPAAGRATADAIPGARLAMIPGLGHELPVDGLDELLAPVLEHLRRHDPGLPREADATTPASPRR